MDNPREIATSSLDATPKTPAWHTRSRFILTQIFETDHSQGQQGAGATHYDSYLQERSSTGGISVQDFTRTHATLREDERDHRGTTQGHPEE